MFAHGFWITNFLGLLGDVFPREAIGTITGLTGTAGGIGGMLSSLAIGAVVDRFSFTPVFAVSGILYPLAFAAILAATHNVQDSLLTPVLSSAVGAGAIRARLGLAHWPAV